MISLARNLYDYRELIATLAWKNVTLRYKQAYLGIAWAILKPLMLMLIFTLVKSFVGIDSGERAVPHPHFRRAHALDLLSGIRLGRR